MPHRPCRLPETTYGSLRLRQYKPHARLLSYTIYISQPSAAVLPLLTWCYHYRPGEMDDMICRAWPRESNPVPLTRAAWSQSLATLTIRPGRQRTLVKSKEFIVQCLDIPQFPSLHLFLHNITKIKVNLKRGIYAQSVSYRICIEYECHNKNS